jgi:L-asparaginase
MLLKAGAVFAGDLTPDKARVMALLALPITKEQKALQAYCDK